MPNTLIGARLSPKALEILQYLSERYGLKSGAIIEMLIRERGRRERAKEEQERKRQAREG